MKMPLQLSMDLKKGTPWVIFNDLEEFHFQKDIGVVGSYLRSRYGGVRYITRRCQNSPAIDNAGMPVILLSNNKVLYFAQLFWLFCRFRPSILAGFHLSKQSLLGAVLSKIAGSKFYLKLDTTILTMDSVIARSKGSVIARTILGFCLQQCTLVTSETHSVLEKVKLNFPRVRSEWVPNTVSGIPALHVNLGKLTVAVAARNGDAQKRSHWILSLTEQRADFILNIFGSSTEEFKNLVQSVGDDRVRLMGIKPRQELLAAFSESDVFVMTSEYEGFSIAALEAASCGCLIVATDVGGIRELTDDFRLGIQIQTPDDLVRINLEEVTRRAREERAERIDYFGRHFLHSKAFETLDEGLCEGFSGLPLAR